MAVAKIAVLVPRPKIRRGSTPRHHPVILPPPTPIILIIIILTIHQRSTRTNVHHRHIHDDSMRSVPVRRGPGPSFIGPRSQALPTTTTTLQQHNNMYACSYPPGGVCIYKTGLIPKVVVPVVVVSVVVMRHPTPTVVRCNVGACTTNP